MDGAARRGVRFGWFKPLWGQKASNLGRQSAVSTKFTQPPCLWWEIGQLPPPKSRPSPIQRLWVNWGQCCPRVAASPCLLNGPSTQLSPYFTRNPLYGYTIFTHIRRDTWKTSHFGLQHLGVPCHTAWWKPGTILKETSLDSERSRHVGGCLTGARDVIRKVNI